MSPRRAWSAHELAVAVALALGTGALLAHHRAQTRAADRAEAAAAQAAFEGYRQRVAPLIAWHAQAPDFSGRDLRGHPFRLYDRLKGARYLVLAFFQGNRLGNGPVAADLELMRRRYGGRGLAVAGVVSGADAVPAWLEHWIGYPLLPDPGAHITRSYGATITPTCVLIDRTGRVEATEAGRTIVAGTTYTRQAVETRFDGYARLIEYDPVLRAGAPFPPFVAQTRSGAIFTQDNLRGHWTLFVLSMEDCPACGALEDTLRPWVAAARKRGGVTVWADGGRPEDLSSVPDVALRDSADSLVWDATGLALPRACVVDPDGVVRKAAEPPLDDSKLAAATTAVGSRPGGVLRRGGARNL